MPFGVGKDSLGKVTNFVNKKDTQSLVTNVVEKAIPFATKAAPVVVAAVTGNPAAGMMTKAAIDGISGDEQAKAVKGSTPGFAQNTNNKKQEEEMILAAAARILQEREGQFSATA